MRLQQRWGPVIIGTVLLLSSCAHWSTSGNHIHNTNSGNVGIGVSTPDGKLTVVEGPSTPVETGTFGIKATTATKSRSKGVYGESTAVDGLENSGGYFADFGARGAGVWGVATNEQASGGSGGVFHSSNKAGHGVIGIALNEGNETNYGGWFAAKGKHGIGIRAKGGPEGQAAQFLGVVEVKKDDPGPALKVDGCCGVGGSLSTEIKGGIDVSGGGVLRASQGYAVWAIASEIAHAGLFEGDVEITGRLVKGAGGFKIDHPLEPESKYLHHSFVESPDMMNVYNGNVTLDDNGEAVVRLPTYFEALNKDFRYQLTPIGGPAPNLYIARKVSHNSFEIGGGSPGSEVSWQVTGVRKDAYAEAHPLVPEVPKEPENVGRYLHPLEFGHPAEEVGALPTGN